MIARQMTEKVIQYKFSYISHPNASRPKAAYVNAKYKSEIAMELQEKAEGYIECGDKILRPNIFSKILDKNRFSVGIHGWFIGEDNQVLEMLNLLDYE